MGTRALRECLQYMREQHGHGSMEDAEKELREIVLMCRTLKEMGVGAFRDVAQVAIGTLDAVAKEPPIP